METSQWSNAQLVIDRLAERVRTLRSQTAAQFCCTTGRVVKRAEKRILTNIFSKLHWVRWRGLNHSIDTNSDLVILCRRHYVASVGGPTPLK